jgi:2-iminobutanoate/2-iminopropanoate deaminase
MKVTYYPVRIGGVEQSYPNVHPGTPKYAGAIVTGDLCWVSGMTAQSFEDGSCLASTVEEQVFVALDKARMVLEEAGPSMENVFKNLVLLKDIEYYQQMRAAELKYYQKYAPRLVKEPPTGTFIQPANLARPEFLVEFEMVAVMSRDE